MVVIYSFKLYAIKLIVAITISLEFVYMHSIKQTKKQSNFFVFCFFCFLKRKETTQRKEQKQLGQIIVAMQGYTAEKQAYVMGHDNRFDSQTPNQTTKMNQPA